MHKCKHCNLITETMNPSRRTLGSPKSRGSTHTFSNSMAQSLNLDADSAAGSSVFSSSSLQSSELPTHTNTFCFNLHVSGPLEVTYSLKRNTCWVILQLFPYFNFFNWGFTVAVCGTHSYNFYFNRWCGCVIYSHIDYTDIKIRQILNQESN